MQRYHETEKVPDRRLPSLSRVTQKALDTGAFNLLKRGTSAKFIQEGPSVATRIQQSRAKAEVGDGHGKTYLAINVLPRYL